MKILITTDWYTPAVNGVVTSVKNLQRELERRGHEVRILTLSQSLHSWSRDGVTAIGSVNAGRIYPGARLRTAMAGRWVRELMDWRPDVIHSQCEFSTFFLARRIAEELDVPLVHTSTVFSAGMPRLARRTARRMGSPSCWKRRRSMPVGTTKTGQRTP